MTEPWKITPIPKPGHLHVEAANDKLSCRAIPKGLADTKVNEA